MFKFNGISSDDMGVIAEEEDFFTRAPIRFNKTNIDGMNGSLYHTDNVLEDVKMQFKIQLIKDNYDEVLKWLKGKGIFEFRGRVTEAFFFDELHLERKACIKVATVNCIRRPTWTDANDTFKTVTNNVMNLGNTIAYPIIKITAKPNVAVSVSVGSKHFYCQLEDNGSVIIDCQNMTETDENGNSVSQNVTMGFDYPKLLPGSNDVFANASPPCDVKIEIKNRSAYL